MTTDTTATEPSLEGDDGTRVFSEGFWQTKGSEPAKQKLIERFWPDQKRPESMTFFAGTDKLFAEAVAKQARGGNNNGVHARVLKSANVRGAYLVMIHGTDLVLGFDIKAQGYVPLQAIYFERSNKLLAWVESVASQRWSVIEDQAHARGVKSCSQFAFLRQLAARGVDFAAYPDVIRPPRSVPSRESSAQA